MKIRLLIHNGYVGGGTARVTLTTAAALHDRGHDVEIISMYRRRETPIFPPAPGVRIRPLVDTWEANNRPGAKSASPRKKMSWAVNRVLRNVPTVLFTHHDGRWKHVDVLGDIQLYRYIRAQRDGVLVGTRPGINLALARWARPGPVVVGQDHLNTSVYKQELKDEIRCCFPRLDALVSLTEADADAYAELIDRRTRTLSIPNGVPDLGDATAAPGGDSKLVVAAGRMTRQKGFDRLVDAWALVAPDHPDWRLEIYGSGDTSRLQKQVDRLGLGGSVHLMGRTSELWDVMSLASMYVMSSRFEGFPMVLLEAMGVGLPVVSFDCPTGPRDLIDDGANGYLVPDGDIPSLARRIGDLIESPDTRRSMGAAAKKTAEGFSPDSLAQRWEELFAELAADPTRAARRARPSLGRRSADPCRQAPTPAQVLRLLMENFRHIRLKMSR